MVFGREGLRYSLGTAPIGRGGQAEVWAAEREDGVRVAIKFARPAPQAVEALDSEGYFLDALSHGGVDCAVRCLDRVAWAGRPGLVLPWLPQNIGGHLQARLDADPIRPIEVILEVAARLVDALAALHAAPLQATPPTGASGHLVHRDVKPENVLVDPYGNVRISDLGGSLLVSGDRVRELGVFGSLAWAPLDQMLPAFVEPSPTWDTYAACGMLFFWLTGESPSFQIDPSERTTPRGQGIWDELHDISSVAPEERLAVVERLFALRNGSRVGDVLVLDAPPVLPAADIGAVVRAVAATSSLDAYDEEAVRWLVAGLVAVLARGLAPQPEHRFASATELAKALWDLHGLLAGSRRRRTLPPQLEPPRVLVAPVPVRGPHWVASLFPVFVLGLLVAIQPGSAPPPEVETIAIPAAPGVPEAAVRISRSPVTNQGYADCVTAGACSAAAWASAGSASELGVGARGEGFRGLTGPYQPAVGVTAEQAAAWCAWDQGRLPRADEWGRARGLLTATRASPRASSRTPVVEDGWVEEQRRRVGPSLTWTFRCVYPEGGRSGGE